jgi:hypothetical protein
MALPGPLLKLEDLTKLISNLKLVVPEEGLDDRIYKFNKLINDISDKNIIDTNIRIIGDLTHDIGGHINTNIGKSNTIEYLGKESGLKTKNNVGKVQQTSYNFLTSGGGARPRQILDWMDSYLKSEGLNIQLSTKIYDEESSSQNIKLFLEQVKNAKCNTIILDAQHGNTVRDYFKNNRWEYIYPTVGWADGSSKLSSDTVESYGIVFKSDPTPFKVYKFFNSRIHDFQVNETEFKSGIAISKYGNDGRENSILQVFSKGGFSVDGICKMAGLPVVRGASRPNVPDISTPLNDDRKKELILVKTITDYSQVYYAALLYHIFDFKTLFITNDTFCLRLACLFRLPFVILSKMGVGGDCYVFDNNAFSISDEDMASIKQQIGYYRENNDVIYRAAIDKLNADRAVYISEYNKAKNIQELIAADIILNDFVQLESTIRNNNDNLMNGRTDDDYYKSLISILSLSDLSSYLYDAKTKSIVDKKYNGIKKLIKTRISALLTQINSKDIYEYIMFLRSYIADTLHLKTYGFDILSLLISLTFYNYPSSIHYLTELFFSRPPIFEIDYDAQIGQFRNIAAYMFVFSMTQAILSRLFFKLKLDGTQQKTFDVNVNSFIPIVSFFSTDAMMPPPDTGPKSINESKLDSEVGDALNAVLNGFYNDIYKTYMEVRITRLQSTDISLYYKYTTQVYAMKYAELPDVIVRMNKEYSRKMGGLKIEEGDMNDANKLKNLRAKVFKYIFDNNNGVTATATPKKRGRNQGERLDYFPVAFIDYMISKLEPTSEKDFLQTTEKYLNIYLNSVSREILSEEQIGHLKDNISYYINWYNYNYQRKTSSDEISPHDGNQSGGNRNIVHNIIPYTVINPQNIDVTYHEYNIDNLLQQLTLYIQRVTSKSNIIYKPSISSNYLATIIPKIYKMAANNTSDLATSVIKLYGNILIVLKILKGDAVESDEGNEYQEKIDELYLYLINYDYNTSITPADLCRYMLNYLLNDTLIEKYFFNLLDPKKQIVPLLSELQIKYREAYIAEQKMNLDVNLDVNLSGYETPNTVVEPTIVEPTERAVAVAVARARAIAKAVATPTKKPVNNYKLSLKRAIKSKIPNNRQRTSTSMYGTTYGGTTTKFKRTKKQKRFSKTKKGRRL